MPEFYKKKIPIVRRSLNEAFLRGIPAKPLATGAVPRNFLEDPLEMRDSPSEMKLYSESEWDALYDAGEEAEDSLEHLFLRDGKPAFEFLDQNGYPDCWTHSTAHAVMIDYFKQNLPVPRLNAVAVATMLGRTGGGWSGLSMKFGRDHGWPLVGTGAGKWPYQSRRGKDTPELRASMKKYRTLEDWYDLGRREWDQVLNRRQVATCLFDNNPVPSDYDEYAHAMLSIRLVRIERNSWGLLTLNSWQGFGYHGLCVLAERWPDGSCALRSSTPTA